MPTHPHCAPDGQHCARCSGVHNPRPGVAFETSRTWGTDDEQRCDGKCATDECICPVEDED